MPVRQLAHQLLMLQSSPAGERAGGPSIRQPNHVWMYECQGLCTILKYKSLALELASGRSKCIRLLFFGMCKCARRGERGGWTKEGRRGREKTPWMRWNESVKSGEKEKRDRASSSGIYRMTGQNGVLDDSPTEGSRPSLRPLRWASTHHLARTQTRRQLLEFSHLSFALPILWMCYVLRRGVPRPTPFLGMISVPSRADDTLL